MKALLLINAYSKDEEYLYQPYRMKEEFEKMGVPAVVMRNDSFSFQIDGADIASHLQEFDFCVYWDKDKYILSMLQKLGIRTFNSCEAIEKCDDKMLTQIELSGQGIPMAVTLPGLLCYEQDIPLKKDAVEMIEEKLHYPLIVKQSYGSKGKGVFLVKDRSALLEKMEELKCQPHLFQEYVASSFGRDLRVIVIGDRVVGGMLRRSNGDFRSNIGAGGNGENYILHEEEKSLSLRIARILGLDYCGIDLLFGEKGPIVCEVNSNAFFFAFEKATKINVANIYAEYIVNIMAKTR